MKPRAQTIGVPPVAPDEVERQRAELSLRQTLANRDRAARNLRNALRQADRAARELRRHRDFVAEARREARVVGADPFPSGSDEEPWSDGLADLTGFIGGGPERPVAEAEARRAESERLRFRQLDEQYSWVIRSGHTRNAAMLPEPLRSCARDEIVRLQRDARERRENAEKAQASWVRTLA